MCKPMSMLPVKTETSVENLTKITADFQFSEEIMSQFNELEVMSSEICDATLATTLLNGITAPSLESVGGPLDLSAVKSVK